MEGAARSVAIPVIGRRVGWLIVGAGVLLVVLAWLLGAAAILLVGCVVAGFGITYLSQIALNLKERLAFGAVQGAMAVSLATLLLSMVLRIVLHAAVLTSIAFAFGTGMASSD